MLAVLVTVSAGLLSGGSAAAAAEESVITPDQLVEYPTGHLTNISQVIPSGYDKSAFPEPADGGTMYCFLRLGVENVLQIDEHNGVVRYQVFLSVYWPDPRLKLPELQGDINSVSMDPSAIDKLWLPDLIIYNLEDVQSVRLLQDLGSLKLLRNGYLKYELYLRTAVTCNMDFTSYPFDVQECDIELGSYSYNSSVVSWNWMNNKNIYAKDKLQLKSFTVFITMSGQILHCYGDKHDVCFQNVLVRVQLRRRTVFFLWHTLLPCVLLVATSWLSMMLPPEIIPGRMVLCITSLLALLTLFTSSLTGLEVSYIRASDIWYVGCLIFDFLIILEYVVLIFIQRMKQAEVGDAWARPTKIHPIEKTEVKQMGEEEKKSRQTTGSRLWQRLLLALEDSARMDYVCRIVLALLFVCFSLGYAGYYTLL